MFNNKKILITGGSGSFGKAFIRYLLNKNLKKIIVFSRDENKQYEMQKFFPITRYKNIRYFIGDVRDLERLKLAFKEVDMIVHAAAMKQIVTAEYNSFEAIKTNIMGTQNVINASLDCKVKKVVLLSTDKACSPINLYGATKLAAEKLFVTAKNYAHDTTKFSVVRYGNVNGSRGSVIPLFIESAKKNILPITDQFMTRFSITMEQAIKMVEWSFKHLGRGEILIPKIPSYRLIDLAKCFDKCKLKYIGRREGEKVHEDLITPNESLNCIELKKYYLIINSRNIKEINKYINIFKGKKTATPFSYDSFNNKHFLKPQELKNIIKKISNNIF
jgi:UDP-N-acetylglucosamine 4,6-dehydratase (inverting)